MPECPVEGCEADAGALLMCRPHWNSLVGRGKYGQHYTHDVWVSWPAAAEEPSEAHLEACATAIAAAEFFEAEK